MRRSLVMAIFRKEWREIVSNKLLLGVVAAPALIFAAIPTLIVAGASESDARSIPEAAQRALLFFSEPTWYLGDVAWMLGLLLIPVGIALIFVIVRNQRVDQGARGSAGVPVGRQRKERNNNRPR